MPWRGKWFQVQAEKPLISQESAIRLIRALRGFQPSAHFGSRDQTSLLENETSTTQNHEVGDGLHAESRGCLGAFLSIHLQDQGAARHFACQQMNFRRCHPAGSAPRRPEIRQDRNGTLSDDLAERVVIDIQGLVESRQR